MLKARLLIRRAFLDLEQKKIALANAEAREQEKNLGPKLNKTARNAHDAAKRRVEKQSAAFKTSTQQQRASETRYADMKKKLDALIRVVDLKNDFL